MYTITDITTLTNVSARTLRYYDEINLLKPTAYNVSGYRLYDQATLEKLHRILLYKQFGFSLKTIQQVIDEDHLLKKELLYQQEQVEKEVERLRALQKNITLKLKELDGVYEMTEHERFELFKQERIEKNDKQFGKELREKYSDVQIDRSNEKILKSTKLDFENQEAVEKHLFDLLEVAKEQGIEGEIGKEIVRAHKEWLMYSWSTYNISMHRSVALMYITDERFKSYYEKYGEGFATILYEAIERYVERI